MARLSQGGIFNAAETITGLSGIADLVPVFSEARALADKIAETRGSL